MRASRLGCRAGASGAAAMIEPDRCGETCWPALDLDTESVLLMRAMPADIEPTGKIVILRTYVGGGRARSIFDWMCLRPGDWPLWGRLAYLFGEEAVRSVVIAAAEREAEKAAIEAEEARLEEEERIRLRRQIDLYILDPKSKRPGLSLQSGDEKKPFFLMSFSEKWERERVLDWLRWQKHRFHEFRDLFQAEGPVALERLVIAGMRATEAEIRTRGLASRGRRPLRFWRGE